MPDLLRAACLPPGTDRSSPRHRDRPMIARALYLVARLIGRPLALIALLSAAVIGAARIYAHHLAAPPTLADARRVNLAIAGVLAVAAAFWFVRRATRWFAFLSPLRSRPTSLGSARWGSTRRLESPHGFIVGRGGRWHSPLLRYAGDAHILTLAPTGAGKGVSCVIPALLDYPGSMFVIDPKGENYAVTADYRRSIGHEVVALDPFGLAGGTGSFNPMESLDVSDPACVDEAAALAEMLVVRDPRASADTMFWSEEAKALIAGLILLVAESGGMHTMTTLWEIVSVPPRDLTKLWRMMSASTGAGGAIQRAGDRMMQKADRVRSSVLAEAQSHMHFLESTRLADVMSSSSFSFSDLKTSRTTVYVIVPPDRLDISRRCCGSWSRPRSTHSFARPASQPTASSSSSMSFPHSAPCPPSNARSRSHAATAARAGSALRTSRSCARSTRFPGPASSRTPASSRRSARATSRRPRISPPCSAPPRSASPARHDRSTPVPAVSLTDATRAPRGPNPSTPAPSSHPARSAASTPVRRSSSCPAPIRSASPAPTTAATWNSATASRRTRCTNPWRSRGASPAR